MNRVEWLAFKREDPVWQAREIAMEKKRAYERGYWRRRHAALLAKKDGKP